jgi:hypothetical protein
VTGWVRVFGMVNSAPGYSEQHLVMNGFSDLILQVFGPEVGRHARSAIGTAGLPMNFAMEVEAEVLIGVPESPNGKGRPSSGGLIRISVLGSWSGVSALAGLEPALGLVDHVDPALAAHDAAIAMALLERAERVLDLHRSSPSSRRGDAP